MHLWPYTEKRTLNNYWMRLSMISWIIKTEVCVHRHEVLIVHDIMRKPNSIIVLLYIFHIIHTQKQKQSVQPFCFWEEHSKGLSNQADVELDMINALSAADVAFITSYCELIECSRPIRFFIVSLMYNNNYYPLKAWICLSSVWYPLKRLAETVLRVSQTV